MADQFPNKEDLQLAFKRLRSIPTNKVCFDCNAKNPTWASVTYGVFICIDCSAVHRSLGVHLTFVRSTQLDTNWTWLQLRQMQLGGNANGTTFFRQHNCTSTDAQQKYNSRAANLYREKLSQLAIQAMKTHGTKLHLEHIPEPAPVEDKQDADFFQEHVSYESMLYHEEVVEPVGEQGRDHIPVAALNIGQPNVDLALSWGDADRPSQERKPTIGGRKAAPKRAGMGGKKGGLGATKVKANFAEIEREATMADQLKVIEAEEAKKMTLQQAEDEEKKMATMRLAYQDLGIEHKKQQDHMKQVDPKKAQQIDRLGMGFASRTGVSHSALSDMQTIEQEGTPLQTKQNTYDRRDSDGFFEDFVFIAPGMSMSRDKSLEAMFFGESNTSRDRHAPTPKATSGWGEPKSGWGEEKPSNKGGWKWEDEEKKEKERPSPKREAPSSVTSTPVTDEAQKKFGGAKAISSDQFFGDTSGNTWERKANLTRFEGSSSISSADYFNNGVASPTSSGASLNAPDLEDVKESVRQGVTKVAGKLSSLANGVMTSLQDRYGY